MRPATSLWLALSLVLLAVTAPTATARESACPDTLQNESEEPGQRFADVVDAQELAVESEINDRWFDARLANATTNESRAAIIADEVARIENRVDDAERCDEELVAARDEGDLEADTARRQLETLSSHVAALHRRVNETADEAAALPEDVAEDYGIDAETIDRLESRVVDLRTSLNENATTGRPTSSSGGRGPPEG